MKPATANINLAPAILVINTPVPAPASPVAQAPPVVENILNAIANLLILGHQVLVNAHQAINTLVQAQAIPKV